jgi:hypothetical protein
MNCFRPPLAFGTAKWRHKQKLGSFQKPDLQPPALRGEKLCCNRRIWCRKACLSSSAAGACGRRSIRSQPEYNGKLTDVLYGFATTRIGEGHVVQDDPKARPGMTKQEIIDRLGWFKELGVTMSGVPIPRVEHIEAYFDYTQWVAEEIMPAVA